jgi:hypothetical protein
MSGGIDAKGETSDFSGVRHGRGIDLRIGDCISQTGRLIWANPMSEIATCGRYARGGSPRTSAVSDLMIVANGETGRRSASTVPAVVSIFGCHIKGAPSDEFTSPVSTKCWLVHLGDRILSVPADA